MNFFCCLLLKKKTAICSYSQGDFWCILFRPCSCMYFPMSSLTTSFVKQQFKGLSVHVGVCGTSVYPLTATVIISSACRDAVRTNVSKQNKTKQYRPSRLVLHRSRPGTGKTIDTLKKKVWFLSPSLAPKNIDSESKTVFYITSLNTSA